MQGGLIPESSEGLTLALDGPDLDESEYFQGSEEAREYNTRGHNV